MDIKTLTAELSVSPQIAAADIRALAAAGLRSVICNRPSTLAWYLKERILPPMYREAMLKGREWLAQPEMVG